MNEGYMKISRVSSKLKDRKFRVLPAQIIETPTGLFLKRGCTVVRVDGLDSTEILKTLFTLPVVTTGQVHNILSKASRRQANTFINGLLERRILVPIHDHQTINHQESNIDIFLWQFNESPERWAERMNNISIVIIGANYISRQLSTSLHACGHRKVRVFDHPEHRNERLFEAGTIKTDEWPVLAPQVEKFPEGLISGELGDCLIVTSDFGGQEALCRWNTICLTSRIHFMPVILTNMVGYVGPLVIPGETPCYACLFSRCLSHSLDPDSEKCMDRAAGTGQAVTGFHPSMATILGDVAAFEITRFYGGALPARKLGTLLEVDLLSSRMTERTVLKAPRCYACSPLQNASPVSLRSALTQEALPA